MTRKSSVITRKKLCHQHLKPAALRSAGPEIRLAGLVPSYYYESLTSVRVQIVPKGIIVDIPASRRKAEKTDAHFIWASTDSF